MDDKARDDQSRGRPETIRSGGDASLDARRAELETKLARHRKTDEAEGGESSSRNGYALAVKLSSEFIAGVAVGALLGYGVDRFFGTSPWGMIVLLLLGFAAGVLNVMRSVGMVAKPKL